MSSTVYTVGVKIIGSAASLVRAAKEALAQTKMLGTGATQEFSKMARAREVLGVRPEREIQREIHKTEAAYNRLARSGAMSFNDQRRAASAMRGEVERLNNEMGRLSTRQKLMRGGSIAAGAATAIGVTGALLAPTVSKTMAYDLRLTHLANTAFNDRDSAGRVTGRRELDATVSDAVRFGGGTRDSAVNTAEALFGAGIFKPDDIKAILREAVMAATANNADPAAFAQMAVSANQTMGIKPEQMGRIFGMGTYAGQSGGFEIKDMAKWLPQQMAAAKAVGLYGERGFAKLAALNQASVVTAGTKDEAGNNVVNLLAKIGSQDTSKDFKKMGIDLPQKLAEGRIKGVDALDVVGDLLKGQLDKDKNYQRVQKELAAAKNDSERTKALTAVGDIAQGTVIGKVFQDRQALMALYAYLNGRERVNTITDGALANPEAAQKNMAVIRDTAGFRVEQAANARDIALQQSMDKMLPAIGGMADGLTGLMTQYPGYTTAVIAAAAAVTGLAGAAGMAALALAARGGGGASTPRLPAAGAALGAVGRAGAVGLAGAAGYGVGSLLYKGLLEGNAAGNSIGRGVAGVASFFGSKSAQEAIRAEYEFDRNAKSRTLTQRLGSGTTALPLLQQDLKGEIIVRVTGAPGLSVQAETKTNSARIPFRTDLGRTNQAAGY